MVSFAYPPAPASQPSLHRPKISLKRDSSHLSPPMSSHSSLVSQAKRLRVAFDDNIDVRMMSELRAKPLELIREEVRAGIEGHLRPGDAQDDSVYDQLRHLFASAAVDPNKAANRDGNVVYLDDKPSSAVLQSYVAALLGRASDLKGCASLVFAVLDINWFGRDESFLTLYVRFLGALGTAIPGCLRPIMERIIRHFAALPSSLGRIPGEAVVGKQQMLVRMHNVLRYLLRLIPSASNSLTGVLRNEFPNHRSVPRRAYIRFVKNLFKLSSYAPEVRGDVLTLITERTVKIDVEIQQEIDDLEEEEDAEERIMGSNKLPLTFDEDEDDDDSDAESTTSTEISVSAEEEHLQVLRDSVSKLDDVLDLLFDHYTTESTRANRYEVTDTFDQLMSQFSTFILPTYRSRHTQFLVFHFAQSNRMNTERFVGNCLDLVLGRGVPTTGSISSSAYLASFVARGARLSKGLVRQVFTILGDHLSSLRSSYEPTCRGPDLGRYGVYYAVAQALLYIYCFRWRDLIAKSDLEDPEADLGDYDIFASGEPTWIPGVKEVMTQNIYCRLNPLKVCSPTIVDQFAAIASHLHFMFVYPLLETNKRMRLSSYRSYTASLALSIAKRESALSAKGGEAHHQLDAFFPFDPYQLPRSKRWLEGDYIEWKGVPGMQEANEDEEDDDESDIDSDEEQFDEDEDEVDDLASASS